MKARPRRDVWPTPDPGTPKAATDPGPGPVFCALGDTLCRVRFFTEAEWAALPPRGRPAGAVHRPGSGYLAPIRADSLA